MKTYNEEEYQTQIIKEREQEIVKTANDINTINAIFKDLNQLVVNQQDAVDDIENQINNSLSSTSDGVNQLTHAKNNQRAKNNYCLCIICFSTFLIFCLFLILKIQ